MKVTGLKFNNIFSNSIKDTTWSTIDVKCVRDRFAIAIYAWVTSKEYRKVQHNGKTYYTKS
jgi:hypothetical protein